MPINMKFVFKKTQIKLTGMGEYAALGFTSFSLISNCNQTENS